MRLANSEELFCRNGGITTFPWNNAFPSRVFPGRANYQRQAFIDRGKSLRSIQTI